MSWRRRIRTAFALPALVRQDGAELGAEAFQARGEITYETRSVKYHQKSALTDCRQSAILAA
jgi:hypothetical protein